AFDTERAQAQLSSTLASIPAREAQVAAAQYRIGTLVGRSPTEVARELEQTAALPQLPEVASIGTPDVVVRYRPDVAAAERFAAAQGALVGAAKASYLPRQVRSQEHTSELQSPDHLVCRLLLEKKKNKHQK